MKEYLKRWGHYALCFEGALLTGIAVTLLFKTPIELLCSPSLGAERVLNAVLILLPSLGSLFVLMRRQGYKTGMFRLRRSVGAIGMVFAVQLALTAMTDGAIWFSGLNNGIAEAVVLGDAPFASEGQEGMICLLTCGITLLADVCLYLPVFLLGESIGAKKRLCDRAELTGKT